MTITEPKLYVAREATIPEGACDHMIKIAVRSQSGAEVEFHLDPLQAPILGVVRKALEQEIDVHPDDIVLVYQNKALGEDDTPRKVGMTSGDVVHMRYTRCMQLIFVQEGEGLSDRISVRLKPTDWTQLRMKEVFSRYAEQAGHEAGLHCLQFSYGGVLLLSCVEMATPNSLGVRDRDEINVSFIGTSGYNGGSQAKSKGKNKKSKKSKKSKRTRKDYESSQWRGRWGILLDGVILNKDETDGALRCNHGCDVDALEPSHAVSKFVDTFFDVLLIHKEKKEKCWLSRAAIHAMVATFDCVEEVWMYGKLKRMAIQILTKMGTNALLANIDMVEIPIAILQLESFRQENILRFGEMYMSTVKKWNKLERGGEREITRFLMKRISCTCLNDYYSEIKEIQAKTGACSVCCKQVDRSTLMVCSKCRFTEYCSRACQEEDWCTEDHKTLCDIICCEDGETVAMAFYDPTKIGGNVHEELMQAVGEAD